MESQVSKIGNRFVGMVPRDSTKIGDRLDRVLGNCFCLLKHFPLEQRFAKVCGGPEKCSQDLKSTQKYAILVYNNC